MQEKLASIRSLASEENKTRLLASEQPRKLAEIFRVLGDTTRIKLILALLYEEKCVQHLAENISMSQSAVSHQLRLLKTARLVKTRREGKNIVYSLDDDHIEGLVAQGLEHASHT